MKNLKEILNESLFDNVGVGLEHSISQWFVNHGLNENQFRIEEVNDKYFIDFNNDNMEEIFLEFNNENFKSFDDVLPYKGLLNRGFPGNLLIENNKLFNSFDGFPCLITGALSIENCPNLKSLKDMTNDGVYGLIINNCKNLSKFDAKLDFCSSINIINCPKLKNLDELNVRGALDYVSLEDCPNLEFDDVKNIMIDDLYIKNCPKLSNLKTTKNIKKIMRTK